MNNNERFITENLRPKCKEIVLIFQVSRIPVLYNDVIGENEAAAIVEREPDQKDEYAKNYPKHKSSNSKSKKHKERLSVSVSCKSLRNILSLNINLLIN